MSIFSIFIILLFFLALFQSSVTFAGAYAGLMLWFCTLVPTLFPYMIFSSMMIRTKGLDYLGSFCGKLFCRIFRVSEAGTFAVISGFLCGYPMGARVTADLVKSGRISHAEGNYLLTFTNSTSPAFVMNYLAASQLGKPELAIVFLIILYLSAYLTSLCFHRIALKPQSSSEAFRKTQTPESPWQVMEAAICQSSENMIQIGGYIILFSVLIFHLSALTDHPVFLTIGSFLEITNGIPLIIKEIPSGILQYILLMALTAFGGACSIIQTQGMISDSGLNLNIYIASKITQACIAAVLILLWFLIL